MRSAEMTVFLICGLKSFGNICCVHGLNAAEQTAGRDLVSDHENTYLINGATKLDYVSTDRAANGG